MDQNKMLRLLSDDLALSSSEIRKIVASAPYRYKHYRLKKRTEGYRNIYHPTPELKAIQWWIVSNIIHSLPVHPAVFSYRRGIGIQNHANVHANSNFFLRFDFTDFFPSITYRDVVKYLTESVRLQQIDLDKGAIELVAWLVCRAPKGRDRKTAPLALSIGAPSSPAVSNTIIYSLDTALNELSVEHNVRYSRYADDLYFSTKERDVLSVISKGVKAIIKRQKSPKLRINEKKTSYVSRKYRVQITGVVVTPSSDLSVGRNRKRFVRSQVHKYVLGDLGQEEISSVRGMIAFIRSIEPDFVDRLIRKYGEENIKELL